MPKWPRMRRWTDAERLALRTHYLALRAGGASDSDAVTACALVLGRGRKSVFDQVRYLRLALSEAERLEYERGLSIRRAATIRAFNWGGRPR